jgi:endonuclease/exonuclease/phosphatase (EEP) superfamily protein YafD
MASNRILSSKTLATITKSGADVVLAAATETQQWKRPEAAVQASASAFVKAVEKSNTPLPAGTAKVIMW